MSTSAKKSNRAKRASGGNAGASSLNRVCSARMAVSMDIYHLWNGQKPSMDSINGLPAKLVARRKIIQNGQPMMAYYFRAQNEKLCHGDGNAVAQQKGQ